MDFLIDANFLFSTPSRHQAPIEKNLIVSPLRLFRNMNRASFKGSCLNVQLSQVKVQKLFLGNLPKEASCAEIQQLFESYGAKVMICFAFLSFRVFKSTLESLTLSFLSNFGNLIRH